MLATHHDKGNSQQLLIASVLQIEMRWSHFWHQQYEVWI